MSHATCASCGGNVVVRLAGPPVSCEYCGAQAPLSPDVAAHVERLRVDVSRSAGRAQQLVGKQIFSGQSSSELLLIMVIVMWPFVGAMLYYAPGSLPAGVSFGAFLFEVTLRSAADSSSVVLIEKWWFLFVAFTGATFNLALWSIARLRYRGVVRTVLPQAPAASGRPPRCRCCGADLPMEGALRRCAYCQAEHVVLGERYQRHQTSLAAALEQMAKQTASSLEQRNRSALRLLKVGTLMPLLALLLMPIALFVPKTYPMLWSVGCGFVLITVIFVIAGNARALPRLRGLYQLAPGDGLLIANTRYDAIAHLEVWVYLSFPKRQDLIFLQQARAAHAEQQQHNFVAVIMHFDGATDGTTASSFSCQPGGEAFAAATDGVGENAVRAWDITAVAQSYFAQRDKVWVVPEVNRAGDVFEGLRMWSQQPQEGSVPEMTLTRTATLPEEDLVLIDGSAAAT